MALPRPPGMESLAVRPPPAPARAGRARSPAADVLLMAAAVADYRPATVREDKIKKTEAGDTLALELDDVEAKPGWTQSRTGQAVTWSGGLIPKGTFARFSIRGTAPNKSETVLFNVLVGDRTGKSITYRVGLDVTELSTQDKGARTLGKAALGVAILAAALGLAALFAGLYLWRSLANTPVVEAEK